MRTADGAAQAAEVKVLSALAVQPVMDDIGPKFERVTGHKLVITFASMGAIVRLGQAGAHPHRAIVHPTARVQNFA